MIFLKCFVLAAICAFSASRLAWGEPLQLAPQDGVLFLREGGMIQGKISRVGDRYYVALEGGEIRVRSAEVEMCCRDLDDAYQRKSNAPGQARAADRLDLAEWCIRYGLLGYAARELLAARRIDASHPKIPLVERRLQLAVNPPRLPKAANDGLAEQAPRGAVDERLPELPAGALETFTNHVQPLVLNRCSAAACHGPAAANGLHLERTSSSRPLTQRITQRNMLAVLAFVDRDAPSASPLLEKPLAPHGGMSEPVFAKHDLDQYQHLVAWAAKLSRTNTGITATAPLAAPLVSNSPPPEQTAFDVNAPPDRRAATNPAARGGLDAKPLTKKTEGAPVEQRSLPVPRQLPIRGAPPTKPLAKDPFDPEIFNRQFSPAGKG